MTMEPPASLHCENSYTFLKHKLQIPKIQILNSEGKFTFFVAAETHMKEVKDDVFLHSKKCDTK